MSALSALICVLTAFIAVYWGGLLTHLCTAIGAIVLVTFALPFLHKLLPVPNLKRRYHAEWALVTGGSSGIGRSMVDRLAEQGLNVIIVALPGILLQNTAKDLETRYPNQRFEAIGVNFSPGVDYMAPIVSATRDKAVQIVVSNAGYIKTGFFDQISANQNIALIECNAVACVRIAHHFVSQMVSSRRRGCVIITSSMAAYMPTGLVSMYGATKAFLSSFGAALYAENSSRGVDICTAHPAAVSTRLGSDTRPLDASAFFNLFALDPDDLPDAMLRAVGRVPWVDIGAWAVILRLAFSIFNYNVVVALTGWLVPRFSGDFTRFNRQPPEYKSG